MKILTTVAFMLMAQQAGAQAVRPGSLVCVLPPTIRTPEAARIRFRTDGLGRLTTCDIVAASSDAAVTASACAEIRANLIAAPVRHRNLDTEASCLSTSGSGPPPAPPPPPPFARSVGTSPRLLSPDQLMGDDDYPIRARRALAEGAARARLSVDADGRADTCEIIQTSGDAALDQATCRAFRRARYVPGRDPVGKAVRGTTVQTIRWRLPEMEPEAPRIFVERGPDGRVGRCELRAGPDKTLPFALDECRRLDELTDGGPLASGVPFELAAPEGWPLPAGLKKTDQAAVVPE